MSNNIVPSFDLIIPELSGSKIRRTQDGRFSVYDLIRICGNVKNPHQFWNGSKGKKAESVRKGLVELYPELLHGVEFYTFPGKGRNTTPVANVEKCLEILALLPGACGQSYRQEAASLVRRYLEGDISIALSIIDRVEDEADLKQVKARVDAKISNKSLNAAIQSAGGSCFAMVANINNIAILGGTAKQIQAARGVKKTRDGLNAAELSALNLTEIYEQQAIEASPDRGDQKIVAKCKTIADIMAEANRSILALTN